MHTPTPWYAVTKEMIDGSQRQESYIRTLDDDSAANDHICTVNWVGDGLQDVIEARQKANADFIVRAVNSHEGLLMAAKGALAALEHVTGFTGDETSVADIEINLLKRAIAQAEGK
jgi:hypothetical protein